MKKQKVDDTIDLLQKPPEVFAGIMPMQRCLYSSRIYLRRLGKLDVAELFRLYKKNRRYLTKWLQPQPEILRIDNIIALIKEDQIYARRGQRLDLGIFDCQNDAMLGRIALHSVDYGIQRSAGVSYWLNEENAGHGLMTEALATVVSFAFEEAALHRIWLNAINQNLASLKLAAKLGFIKEGILRQNLFINGSWQDSTLFALLENEYDKIADKWIEQHWLGS
ncbi:MAG: GNAT family protein [Candidatus Riflebacteria bacterium]|nr:GNAT family protein [Candidatus Riflebacteria bacterium]